MIKSIEKPKTSDKIHGEKVMSYDMTALDRSLDQHVKGKYMSDKPAVFEREERYMVVKRSKLQVARNDEMEASECVYRAANFGKALVTAVVVEEDWPEYPAVWEMLEERMTGKPSRATQERAAELECDNRRMVNAIEILLNGNLLDDYGNHDNDDLWSIVSFYLPDRAKRMVRNHIETLELSLPSHRKNK